LPGLNYMPHYADAMLSYSEAEIPRLAQELARGLGKKDPSEIQTSLQAAIEDGKALKSIKEIIPAKLAEALGTFDCTASSWCYRAALNFHLDLPLKDNPLHPSHISSSDFIFEHYRPLAAGEDQLRFGDLFLFFKRLGSRNEVTVMHVGIYLGGDLFFHKFGADAKQPFEITTFDGILKHFDLSAQRRVNQFPGIQDWDRPVNFLVTRFK
jgi:cell wall-associated NlpC family hydrolase